MKSQILLPGLLIALFLIGCGGGDSSFLQSKETPAKTRTARPKTPKATANESTPASVPSKPSDPSDYAAVIADYLNDAGDSAIEGECLEDLFDEWELTGNEEASSLCVAQDVDGDAPDELVVLIEDVTSDGLMVWQLLVFDGLDEWKAAFETEPVEVPAGPPAAPELLTIEDVNGDGNAEVVYSVSDCGAHTCYVSIHVLSAEASGFVDLAPPEMTMAYAEVSLEDEDGDGALEILLHGGEIGSVGAGPQRTRTDIWDWDGATYVLKDTVLDPTDILYLHVTEADSFFAVGHYDASLSLYQQALYDPSLKTWREPSEMVAPEREELSAYMLFRIGLSAFGAGSNNEGRAYVQQVVDEYGGYLHGDMANAFLTTYLIDENVSAACFAVKDFIAANSNLFEAFWDYGYANPTFSADAVCPF